ncbi:hypothetical protein [Microvirga lotononidis]|uniref:Uncharacterized protein n=1 Tax=Microvirga lotononidis TaxID=864069 RepID=I4YQJ5_9HYPH|nr:hypothetical protein [Microvirga lotononidis]EIM26237.1 hypothetical protein MicloDRAFT_00027860 [Microvirga lotononidis]WQO30620.1 hypothetical protein U0023_24610 [Microvirga lotononidis]
MPARYVLKGVKGNERTSNLFAYSDPDLPLAPGVIDTLSAFIVGTSPTQAIKAVP